MTTARKPLPTAARIAVRDATEAAQTAASYLRQVRRAQTAATPGDRDLADALTELERIVRLLSEAQQGGSMEEKGTQVPSVGRMVHYVAYGTPGGEYTPGKHRAAIITEVYTNPTRENPDNLSSDVGLCILNPTGQFFNQRVPFDLTGQQPGTWHWMEYQPPNKGGSS